MNNRKANRVVVPCRFSYAHVFEPHAINDGDTPKYSVSCIIPKDDVKSVETINKAIQVALQEGASKFGGKIPNKYKNPLRDGDDERPDDSAYANAWFFNANSTKPVGVVDRNRQPILDTDEFYSGCYGYISVTFYAYNTSGNKGVACGLNNVLKSKDGDRLGGARISAEDDFANISIDDVGDDFLD